MEGAAGNLQDELGQALGGHLDLARMHAPLEPVAGVGVEAVSAAGVPHGDRVERRGLEQQIRCRVADRRQRPTLDAGDRHRTLGIGNDQVSLGEIHLAGSLADRKKRLAVEGQAHDDLGTGQLGQVEDVSWLAEFKEHEVARVDDVVAGDLVDRPKPVGQPQGRGSDGHAADEPARVERAQLGLAVRDGEYVARGAAGGLGRGLGDPQATAGNGGDLPCQADVTDAVAAIGGHLELLANVRATEGLARFQREAGPREQLSLLLGGSLRVDVFVHPVDAGQHGTAQGTVNRVSCHSLAGRWGRSVRQESDGCGAARRAYTRIELVLGEGKSGCVCRARHRGRMHAAEVGDDTRGHEQRCRSTERAGGLLA